MRKVRRAIRGIAYRIRQWPWKKMCITALAALVLALVTIAITARRECALMPSLPSLPAEGSGSTLAERFRRPEDNTYLTFPEWYIVYSAEEYAATLKTGRPSAFAYVSAAGQYWCAYGRVGALTRGRYPSNGGYQLMLGVIGTSFTAEELVKGAYENTVGRVFEWLSFGQVSAEDEYAQEVAADYAAFMHTLPWYEFPFGKALLGLWKLEPFGDAPLRKVERRIVLTLEYVVKAAYGKLVAWGTGSIYAPEDLTIRLVARGTSGATLVETLKDGRQILEVPRYEAFTRTIERLAEGGVAFVEIGGNDEILLTALVPSSEPVEVSGAVPVLALRSLVEPGKTRMGWRVPVDRLSEILGALKKRGIEIEHLYDY